MQQSRLEAIEDLIARYSIGDQHALVDALKEHYDIETNQAAVSRDLHKLGVIKTKVDGKLIYQMSTDPKIEILKLGIEKIVHNEMMVVVHTLPGLADFVGDYLDGRDELPIIGTLAGENVVFIIPSSTKEIERTSEAIAEALYHHPEEISNDE